MPILSGDGIHSGGRWLSVETFRGREVAGWLNEPVKATLEMLIDRFDVGSVVEVGSFVGRSACWFAERVDEVVCVDRFDRTLGEGVRRLAGDESISHYDLFLANTEAYPNITHYKMDSLTAAGLLVKADLVYIDADHTYEGVKADVEAWTPHACKVICGDDNTDQWPGVQQYAREIGANVEERVWWKPV